MASVPFENSNRDGRCCSTGMPEKVNFAESSTSSPSMAASVSSGTLAAPFAEKLPTTPPVATLPVRR